MKNLNKEEALKVIENLGPDKFYILGTHIFQGKEEAIYFWVEVTKKNFVYKMNKIIQKSLIVNLTFQDKSMYLGDKEVLDKKYKPIIETSRDK